MRLHVLSDLHLEHGAFVPPPVDADVLVLAGDVASGTRGVAYARRWARGRPVVYVAGNHEHYGQRLPALTAELRRAAAGSQVHLLENEELVLGGVRFLGCTLWSDFELAGAEHRAASLRLCARVVNDYEHITFGPQDRPLRPEDTRLLHVASRRWLEQRLAAPRAGPTVVVAHHAPLIRARPADPCGGSSPAPSPAISPA